MTSTDAGRQTMPAAAGPKYTTRQPRLNHVAMSLTPDKLDERHRTERADFYGDVFGCVDIPMMTVDRHRQVFQVHTIEQFVFLIADEPPMACPHLDHFGLSVGAESELDDILARARKRGRRATTASRSSTRRPTTTGCSRSRASTCGTCCR